MNTNVDTYLVLFQVRSTPLGQGLPSAAMSLINCPIRGIMPIINRSSINADNNDDNYEALEDRQIKAGKNYDPLRNYNFFLMGSSVAVQREDGGPWTHEL